jgi:hypothetical protein
MVRLSIALLLGGLAVAAATASAQELMKALHEQDVVCTDETDYDTYLQHMIAHRIEEPGQSCFLIEEPTAIVLLERVKVGKSKVRIVGGQRAGVVGWTDAFP